MRSAAFAAAVATVTVLAEPALGQPPVVIACNTVGLEFQLCEEGGRAWAMETGNAVEVYREPTSSSTERLANYRRHLEMGSDAIDIFQIDLVWVGILADHLIDLRVSEPGRVRGIDQDTIAQHFDAIIENNTVDNRLVAMPWFIHAGLLYYRRDLLEKHGCRVPETWEELTETAYIVMQSERQERERECQERQRQEH